ncbi:uncharacterized protein [Clytia hemisphaerica]|uniref:Uncharacterized protein n=1 Tax=Clytia hemisphaerica TaxID=252671 RepID=A0A7M5XF10_9CNID|eukprot:TCONS_00028177-protein
MYQLSGEKDVKKIRSDIIFEQEERRKTENSGRKIPCFCIENGKHPKWNLCPIDTTPKLYFVNNNRPGNNRTKSKIPLLKTSNEKLKLPSLSSQNSQWVTSTCYRRSKIPRRIDSKETGNDKEQQHLMTLQFRVDSANTDRRKTLKKGYHEKGFYKAPRPHHFRDDIHRPLQSTEELGKPDFKVNIEHDPRNINFKKHTLRNLRIPELASTKDGDTSRSLDRLPMETYKEKEPRFESKLLFPKGKYRKGRDPKDVLYEKIAKAKNLPISNKEFEIQRPDINDHKTVDLLEITRNGPRHKCLNPEE